MTEKNNESGWVGVGKFLLALLLLPFLLVLWAVTLRAMWGWFVTPATSVPPPQYHICLGLLVLIRLVTGTRTRIKKEYREETSTAGEFFISILVCGVTYGMGWLIAAYGPMITL
jgi:hypothetical protein